MHYHPHNPYVNYGKRRTRVSTYLPSGQKITPPTIVICPRCGGDGIAPDCKHFIAKIECGLCGGTGFEKEEGRPIRSYPQLEALIDQMHAAQDVPVSDIGEIPDGWRMQHVTEDHGIGDYFRLPQGKTWLPYVDFVTLGGKSTGTTAYWIRRIA